MTTYLEFSWPYWLLLSNFYEAMMTIIGCLYVKILYRHTIGQKLQSLLLGPIFLNVKNVINMEEIKNV